MNNLPDFIKPGKKVIIVADKMQTMETVILEPKEIGDKYETDKIYVRDYMNCYVGGEFYFSVPGWTSFSIDTYNKTWTAYEINEKDAFVIDPEDLKEMKKWSSK